MLVLAKPWRPYGLGQGTMSTGGRLPVGADMLDIRSERSRPHRIGRPACALNRPTWSPVKAVPLAFPPSAQVLLSDNDFSGSATDTDIISAQHCWTGGLETAAPGCYDAVRDRSDGGFPNAGYEPASVIRRLSFNPPGGRSSPDRDFALVAQLVGYDLGRRAVSRRGALSSTPGYLPSELPTVMDATAWRYLR